MKIRLTGPFKGTLCAAALAAAGAMPALAQEYRMDIQTAVPNASLYFKLTEQFASDVEEMSGGRITVNVLPDGAEVAAFEILDAVSDGVGDGRLCLAALLVGQAFGLCAVLERARKHRDGPEQPDVLVLLG